MSKAETDSVIRKTMLPLFCKSASDAFETMAFTPVTCGEPVLIGEDSPSGSISGTIGLTGAIKLSGDNFCASVSILLPGELAEKIFRSMMMMEADDPIAEDELRDAIGELANMAAGGAKAPLQEQGVDFMISLPTVVVGQNHHVTSPASASSYAIPLVTEHGTMNLEVSISVRSSE